MGPGDAAAEQLVDPAGATVRLGDPPAGALPARPAVPPLDAAAPTGGFDTCVSNFGVFDQSGNVAEWTSDLTLRGGGFSESQLSLQCRSRRTPGVSELPGELFGFRCCSAPQ